MKKTRVWQCGPVYWVAEDWAMALFCLCALVAILLVGYFGSGLSQ